MAPKKTAICAINSWLRPCKASVPTICTTPKPPKLAPASLIKPMVACRVKKHVIKSTNSGDVELSTPDRLLSTYCCPHARTVHTSMLFRKDCTRSLLCVRASLGKYSPLHKTIQLSKAAAITTRDAISVSGRMVWTAYFRTRICTAVCEAGCPLGYRMQAH